MLWWDETKHDEKVSTGIKKNNRPVIFPDGIDPMTLSRWRERLKDPHKFDTELEQATERYVKIVEFHQGGGESYNKAAGKDHDVPIETAEAVV